MRHPIIAFGAGSVLLGCLFTLLAGYSIKAPCVVMEPRSWCYSDIQALWGQRDLVSHALPYLHGHVVKAPISQTGAFGTANLLTFSGHEIEYPVLTGLFVWATTLLAHNIHQYFYINVIVLTALVLFTARLLMRMAGRRVLLFALAPTLAWYAYLNWDVLVVASTVGAIHLWWRQRYWLCGALIGVGICFKAWPAFLLMPLVADLVSRRRLRAAVGSCLAAGAVTAAVNIPFLLANWTGWKAPFVFQSERPVVLSDNSLWPYVWHAATNVTTANHLSEVACAVAFALILADGWRTFRRHGSYPFVQASAAMVASFVALGRVHSPQYALWVLPFFVLLRMPIYWWVAFIVSDAWLFAQWSITPEWLIAPLVRSAVLLSDVVLLAFAAAAVRAPVALQPYCPDPEPGVPASGVELQLTRPGP